MVDKHMFGDLLNKVATEVATEFDVSRCTAIAGMGQLLKDEGFVNLLNLSEEDKKAIHEAVEDFTLATCLNDNEYLFRR